MNFDLIIDCTPTEIVLALLRDKKLIELHRDKKSNAFSVGDIYLGRIKKIMPGLNAAFVDVGYEKDAFLHYLDLGPQYASLAKYSRDVQSGKQKASNLLYFQSEPDIDKGGKINEILQSNTHVVVQIAKEPISTKGPRISSEISLAGRYIVLVPFSDRVSVSQKIRSPEERDRLRKTVQNIKPKNFGVIIRTVAEGKQVSEIEADLNDLISKWDTIFKELKKAQPPKLLLGEIDRSNAILRDMLNGSFNNIHVNDQGLFEEMRNYLTTIAPDKAKILKHYADKEPIFDRFGVDRQIKASFGKTVNMKSGAYLIVEHTEAMHVIDVNSGHRAKSDETQEANALEVNLEAATEVARQLRLRDMGGIIVVDFIDMHNADNRKALFERLKEEMKSDRAKHNILPPSKFGLIQITRQRVRPELNVNIMEECPACNGTGKIQPNILLVDEIEKNFRYIAKELNHKKLTLNINPYIAAFLTQGFFSIRWKWFRQYGKWLTIKPVSSYHILEYHFMDANEEEIIL